MKKEQTYDLVLTALFTAIIVIMAYTPLGYIPLGVINATIIHIPVILGALFLGPKKGAFLGFVFGFTSFLKNTLTPATLSAFVFSPVIAGSQFGPSGVLRSAYICFVPRILVGVVPYFVFLLIRKVTAENNKTGRIVTNLLAAVIMLFGINAFLNRVGGEEANKTLNIVVAAVVAVAFFAAMFLLTSKNSSAIRYVYAGLTGAFTNTLLVMSGIYLLYKEPYAEATGKAVDALLDVILGIVSFNGVVEAIVAAVIITAVGMALAKVKAPYVVRSVEPQEKAAA
jgi:uncharacterized membrane protein